MINEILFWWTLLQEGFIASLVAAIVLPLIGSLLFVRRSALLGVAVPQFSAAGLALGLVLVPAFPIVQEELLTHGHPPMLYSFTFAAGAAGISLGALAGLSSRFQQHKQAIIAVGFILALATTMLLLDAAPIGAQLSETLLRGEIILLDQHGMTALIIVSVLTLAGLITLWRLFLVASYDSEQTHILGHSVQSAERWQILIIGIAIGCSVVTIGPMLVFTLLFIPPLFAIQGAPGIGVYFKRMLIISLTTVILSWPISIYLDFPFSPIASLVAMLVGFSVSTIQRRLRAYL